MRCLRKKAAWSEFEAMHEETCLEQLFEGVRERQERKMEFDREASEKRIRRERRERK